MKIGLYADGTYFCKCIICSKVFRGDKRAVYCLRCAAKNIQAELDNHRWIPVEERLPEKHGRVLVVKAGTITALWLIGKTFMQRKLWKYRGITHWKPIILPEQALKDNK